MIKREPSAFQVDSLIAARDPEQWATLELERCEKDFRGGIKRALAIAIQVSGEFRRPLPDWAVAAFNAALYDMTELNIRSWDEILGGNPRTPKRLEIARRNRASMLAIVHFLSTNSTRAVDQSLWDDLGTVAKISSANAKKLYYQLPEGARLPSAK